MFCPATHARRAHGRLSPLYLRGGVILAVLDSCKPSPAISHFCLSLLLERIRLGSHPASIDPEIHPDFTDFLSGRGPLLRRMGSCHGGNTSGQRASCRGFCVVATLSGSRFGSGRNYIVPAYRSLPFGVTGIKEPPSTQPLQTSRCLPVISLPTEST
jgi:hypothetical protein